MKRALGAEVSAEEIVLREEVREDPHFELRHRGAQL
jgi:hypothetical protein